MRVHDEWQDIPGITASGGQPRLPRQPGVVVETLATALTAADGGGITLADLVDRVQGATGESRQRVEGLAGWLPLSRVAAWDEQSGELRLHPTTDLGDLALRYVAWVASQPIPPDQVQNLDEYVRGILEEVNTPGRAPARRSTESRDAVLPPRPRPSADARRDPLVPPDLTARLRRLLDALDASFLERRQHVRASLLALLAGHHVLLLGPPGTAKSMLARALCECFRDARYFEYLLSRFTHPDELFGPVSIPGLKEEDYRRLTLGYLPQANVAFLDEIFKANSAILNSLLTLVNERVFHHGRHRDAVPLIGLVGASNELPDPDGGLEALYDRFLVRLAVPPLAQPQSFLEVAAARVVPVAVPAEQRLTEEDLATLRAAARRVVVSPPMEDALVALWRVAAREEWHVSDRRWRQAVDMLKIGAAADGRHELDLLDLLLLEPVLAPTPDRAAEVREAILERLGSGAIPRHDLRAQWLLVRHDRVAPAAGRDLPPPPGPGSAWEERVARRRESVERFLLHHQEAVEQLGVDRVRLERESETHLWVHALPVQVLSAHIEAARDLSRILEAAEGYRAQLADERAVARALIEGLPNRSRRVYGHDLACALVVGDLRIGLTLAGERVPLEEGRRSGSELSGENVEVALDPRGFLHWVAGSRQTRTLLGGVPAWAARNVATALESARRLLGAQVVPKPPELPQP